MQDGGIQVFKRRLAEQKQRDAREWSAIVASAVVPREPQVRRPPPPPSPILHERKSGQVESLNTWCHVVDDGSAGLVFSGTHAQKVRICFVGAADIVNPQLNTLAPNPQAPWTEVGSANQGNDDVHDMWHIYAHGCHWVSWCSGGKTGMYNNASGQWEVQEGDTKQWVAQVTHDGQGNFTVQRVHQIKPDLDHSQPGATWRLSEANDSYIVPLAGGFAVSTRAPGTWGSGVMFVHFAVDPQKGPYDADYARYAGVVTFVGGHGISSSKATDAGGVGYLIDAGNLGPVNEIIGPESLGFGNPLGGDLRRFLLQAPLLSMGTLLTAQVLIKADNYVSPPGTHGGETPWHLAMPTAITLDKTWSSPYSPGPSEVPGAWILLTYRAIPTDNSSPFDDQGYIHRRCYYISDWKNAWEMAWSQNVRAPADQGGHGLVGTRNRPHTLRWDYDGQHFVVTVYSNVKAGPNGGTAENGCWYILEDLSWP